MYTRTEISVRVITDGKTTTYEDVTTSQMREILFPILMPDWCSDNFESLIQYLKNHKHPSNCLINEKYSYNPFIENGEVEVSFVLKDVPKNEGGLENT